MKNTLKITLFSVWFLAACGGKENQGVKKVDVLPKVQENGSKIIFPTTPSMRFFATETLGSSSVNDELTATAKVSLTVFSSQEEDQQTKRYNYSTKENCYLTQECGSKKV